MLLLELSLRVMGLQSHLDTGWHVTCAWSTRALKVANLRAHIKLTSGQARVLAANMTSAGRRALARDPRAFCAFPDVPHEAREHLHRCRPSISKEDDTFDHHVIT